MRPLYALLLTIGLIGGMAAYIQFAKSVNRPPTQFDVEFATGKFEVELERTFAAVPFAAAEVKAIEVQLKQQPVFERLDSVPAGETIRFSIDEGVEDGENELVVMANREFLSEGLAAIKVRVLRDDIPVAEKTITGAPNMEMISGTVLFKAETVRE
jgi:hypothetical protein